MNEKITLCGKTGCIHIPTAHRSAPGHPKGTFAYKDSTGLDGGKGKCIQMNPGKENVTIEFTPPQNLVKNPKTYKLSMRFQTDQAQPQPLELAVKKKGKNKPYYTTSIPVTNTHNKWQTMDPPLTMEAELCGDTVLAFTHPKPCGKGILIRDFNLIPRGAEHSGEYSAEWLSQWQVNLTTKLLQADTTCLPALDPAAKQAFRNACKEAHAATRKLKTTNNDKAKEQAEKELKEAMVKCHEAAVGPMLEGAIDPALDAFDFESEQLKELLQCAIIADATPSELAEYAAKGETQVQRLKDFLQGDSIDLMYQMLVHGGPRGGNYGKALDIYAEINAQRQDTKSVFPKLALAVALEFATPLPSFGDPNIFIDPIDRYLHYEKAYLDRELDPAFESFSVWELRMVVNSDAPNDQLAWCRDMIRNYNPNAAVMDDYHWRFAWIVRTDVFYQELVWARKPRDYMQIVSGGGMCGPRAWMGRFACKAFGNPTWGVRQPGHAALTRWTPKGWVTALGGGFNVSWWEDRDGLDFECETKIRMALGDEGYFRKVGMLDWISKAVGERHEVSHVVPHNMWASLAVVQRQRLSKTVKPEVKEIGQCEILPMITELQQAPQQKESITTLDDGSIVVPISCRASATGEKLFQKSFLGGQQVFLKAKEKWELVFRLPANKFPEKRTYKMSARFVTVHEKNPPPLVVTVKDGPSGEPRQYSIPMPYTMGKWQETEKVEVEMGGSQVTVVKLTQPQETKYPLALKEFKLIPC